MPPATRADCFAGSEKDRVVLFENGFGDGFCDYCVAGDQNLCPTMQWVGLSQHDGGYAEYLLVPQERYLIRLHKLEPKVAALELALGSARPAGRVVQIGFAGGTAHVTALKTVKSEVGYPCRGGATSASCARCSPWRTAGG